MRDKEEIICGCFDLKVEDIMKAVENGATTYTEVQEATQVGTACGQCEDEVKELIDELLAQK